MRRVAEKCPNVIPVVVQDWQTKEVLILAYANERALQETLEKGVAVFWSTSRNKLWRKGETSGCVLKIKEVRINCDQNSLLYLVEKPAGIGACHAEDENGGFRESCFYRRIADWANKKLAFVQK
ncbi:phosphoribosyl-AMP cyclohydrolase [bacterium (Candidatus Gribaldobacteria) CG02_land_8_20_14_3_00_41_15]|uniref:Histidine biosynthesis bifunctional protein HisIE n=1 Tax=bacterium (Candidatus Gribaldobacteria) CG02_land_8_20_14_3_00_41_15 TaxID=2014270 RepID=A0A2M7DEF7_9BACT|nr:MAG: phosphoribosyl-AMP cyclohydrolase [bacterium (Candidatus Gribaldobacteria) CG02_land_8_20_14_3_00_41_15]